MPKFLYHRWDGPYGMVRTGRTRAGPDSASRRSGQGWRHGWPSHRAAPGRRRLGGRRRPRGRTAEAGRARALRRRTGWLLRPGPDRPGADRRGGSWAAERGRSRLVDRAATGLALAAAPALVVAVCTVRRVRRRGPAPALRPAPETPVPPALRAAAAHPLVGLPVQLTALTTVPAVVSATGVDLLAGRP